MRGVGGVGIWRINVFVKVFFIGGGELLHDVNIGFVENATIFGFVSNK